MRVVSLMSVLCAAIALASCQTMTPEERRAADEATCRSYGFKAGTDAMARCLLDIDLDRRAEARSWQQRQNDMFFRQPVVIERRVIVQKSS